MILPTFSFEEQAWSAGYAYVVGVDEVGRGALAGPVIAGAVAFPRSLRQAIREEEKNFLTLGIRDSKQMSARQRERLDRALRKRFVCSIGFAGVGEIEKSGILGATKRAMRRAIGELLKNISGSSVFVLLDGFPLEFLPRIGQENQRAFPKGDQRSFAIASASIVAKVYRDALMVGLSRRFPQYGWDQNKGYGTDGHRRAILRYGKTPLHRRLFLRHLTEYSRVFDPFRSS